MSFHHIGPFIYLFNSQNLTLEPIALSLKYFFHNLKKKEKSHVSLRSLKNSSKNLYPF
jgi:hypothetical protein